MGYRNDLYDAGEWDLKSSSALTYDAEKVADFIEDLRYVNEKYNDKIGVLGTEYDHYRDNQTYVGRAADASKYAIESKQKGYLHEGVYNIEKAIYDKYCNLDDMFKAMVDPSPKARINTDVIENIKCDYRRQAETADIVGRVLENSSRYLEQEFGDLGQVTQINYNGVRAIYDEFNGNGGLLDKCVKRMEDYETEALTNVNNSQLDYMVSDLQSAITMAAGGLNDMKTYDPSMPKNSISLVALNMVSPFSRFYGFSKDYSSESVYSDDVIIKTLKDQYGFTDDQAKLINDAYKQYEKKHNNGILKKTSTEKINEFFSNLAALNNGYGTNIDVELDFKIKFTNPKDLLKHPEKILIGESVENFDYNIKGNIDRNKKNITAFNMLGTNPSTEKAIKFFDDLGVDGNELKKALDIQHDNCTDNKKRDFVHECAMFAVMSDDGLRKRGGDVVDDINAAIGYKGDVYSGSMEIDDKMSDVEAYNAYYRMEKAPYGKIWDALTRYNKGVEEGSINGAKEFLEHFGDGDAEEGMKNFKEELEKETPITDFISKHAEPRDVDAKKQEFLGYLAEESGVG